MPRKSDCVEVEVEVTTIKLVEIARQRGHTGILKLERTLSYQEVEEGHRRVDELNFECPNYEDCLMYAAVHRWESWTCILCDGTMQLKETKSRKTCSRS